MSVSSPDSRVTIVFDCATVGFISASLGSSPPKMLNELNEQDYPGLSTSWLLTFVLLVD